MRNFLTRSLVAVIAIPALLWIFHAGEGWMRGLVSVLIVLASYEAWQVGQLRGYPLSLPTIGLLSLAVPWVVLPNGGTAWVVWITCALAANALWVVFRRDAVQAMVVVALQLVAVLLIGVGFGALVGLREFDDGQGFRWLVLLFSTLWIGDTAAYLAGSALRGPKLSPVISPNKTISGAIAQIVASIMVGVTLVLIDWIQAPAILIIVASTVVGTIGQIGDLFESVFKRAAGVKDFSSIIPGHGGVLDRFDSTLLAAPSLWALIQHWPR